MSTIIRNLIKNKSSRNHFYKLTKDYTTELSVKSDSNVISGRPIDPVVGVTVPEYIFENISKYSNATAFTCSVSRRSYTFQQIHDLSYNFAAALLQSGIKPNEIVGVMLPNLPEYAIAISGVWLAGGVVSPISCSSSVDEVIRQCQITESKVIITMPVFLPIFRLVKSQLRNLKVIINIGGHTEGAHSFFEMIKIKPIGVEFANASTVDTINDLAMLPFSSGTTTGISKAIMVTHSNLCSNISQAFQPEVIPVRPDERYIGLLPFYHCFGSSGLVIVPIRNGTHVYTLPRFDPREFIAAIRIHKPTTLHVVAPVIQFMARNTELKKADFESINTVICSAAHVGKRLISRFLEKAGKHIFFQEGYGMTECTTLTHISRPDRKNTKLGSIGEVIPGTKCKVVDLVTGESLPPDKPGELYVSGPQVMKGYYYGSEISTSDMITSDGWLRTGDVVTYDKDECFYIVDRLDELIKVRGLSVSPSELEDLLRTHPDIFDVAVIGVNHEKFGEAPKAYIVRSNPKLTIDNVHDFMEKKIDKHKKLSGGIVFVNRIPKVASGKVLRRLLICNEEFQPKIIN